jgi:hypothetical protein
MSRPDHLEQIRILPAKEAELALQKHPSLRVEQLSEYVLMLNSVSQLLATDLLALPHHYAYVADYPAKPHYHLPAKLDAATKDRYRTTMRQIMTHYRTIAQKLSPAEACAVLPAAAQLDLVLSLSHEQLKTILVHLLSSPLPEAQQQGAALHDQLPSMLITPEESSTVAYQANTHQAIQEFGHQHLPAPYANPSAKAVDLVHVTPRNEFDLIPYMLYGHSSLSLRELQDEVASWPYARKLDAFIAYTGERLAHDDQPGTALDQATYTWDITSPYKVLCELQQLNFEGSLSRQLLIPRYGYDVPRSVEDAELTEQFEACFDLSLQLYSYLQSAGREIEAQYATLLGHKTRWSLTHTARQAFRLFEQPLTTQSADYRKIIQHMHAQLTGVHPLLAAAMIFAHKREDPELARLASERHAQFQTKKST